MGGALLGPAYITGGSSGIGLAIAAELVARGIGVVIFGRNPSRLESARDTLLTGAGAAAATMVHLEAVDVADAASVVDAFGRTVERLGAPRTLIHAAGVADPDYFERITPERWQRQLDINLTGSWNVLQAGVATMRRSGDRPCHVLTLSSQAGIIPVFGYTSYGATKFGVYGLTLALRQELYEEGIYVSVLAPPDVDTPGLAAEEATKPPETRRFSRKTPLRPEYVARYAVRRLARRDPIIVPGPRTRLELLAYRCIPRIGEWIMRMTIQGVSRATKIHTR